MIGGVHSPLPPSPAPSLELIDGKLAHLITVAEVTSARVERLESRAEQVADAERSFRSLAMRLSWSAMVLSGAKIAASAAPSARLLAATAFGAFFGGIVGTWAWMLAHVQP
jgi:hypothetical protein